MSLFAQSRARRAFMRELRITELEKGAGLSLSYPELDLPHVQVVRNPSGFGWDPWIMRGFPGNPYVYSTTRRGCVRQARERLWQLALARSEEPTQVIL